MLLSVVVIAYEMRREVPRTVKTLCAPYQRSVTGDDHEIIVVDNGSNDPVLSEDLRDCQGHIRVVHHSTSSPSPVDAVNMGIEMAAGEFVAVIVDGARMASPDIVGRSLQYATRASTVFVATPAWHLGPDVQRRSTLQGYDQAQEDRLLESIAWTEDGYRLFGISTLAPSSNPCLDREFPTECSWFVMERERLRALGGFDTRFQSAGGGLCNQEFRNRVVSDPETATVLLQDEGVFHQVHGGVTTTASADTRPTARFHEEYEALIGRTFVPSTPTSLEIVGVLPSLG